MTKDEFKQLLDKVDKRFEEFNPEVVRNDLTLANSGAILDVMNKQSCGYYQWIPGLLEEFKPKQIVELGGAMGVADIMFLHALPDDADLWSITLAEHGLEFSYIKEEHKRPNFHMIVGDDREMSNWPLELDLSKTDLWFFDSDHNEELLRTELELYKPFFKNGAIVLFDDMLLNPGMENVFHDLRNIFPIKELLLNPQLHWSGYTVVLVGEEND